MTRDSTSAKSKYGAGRRLAAIAVNDSLKEGFLPGFAAPYVVEPFDGERGLEGWISEHSERVRDLCAEHGAVLIRRAFEPDLEALKGAVSALFPTLEEYTEKSTPRKKLSDGLYTSTEYPQDLCIPQHHEHSYSISPARRIMFGCIVPAKVGGCTPIADGEKVLARLSPDIVQKFEDLGVMYVRNLGLGVDLGWEEVFGTSNKDEVEKYCTESGLEYEWVTASHLRTKQVLAATLIHPERGHRVWFNQLHLFHVSSLGAEAEFALRTTFDECYLPRNTYYGDGSPIEPSVLDAVRGALSEESIRFAWMPGDLMILDNLRFTHGRDPFEGPRQIVVSLSGKYSRR